MSDTQQGELDAQLNPEQLEVDPQTQVDNQEKLLQEAEGSPGLGREVAAGLDERLGSLQPVHQAFIADMLTPEMGTFLALVFGEDVFSYFADKIDNETYLLPLPREVLAKTLQEQDTSVDAADATSPVVEPQPPEGAAPEEATLDL